MATITHCIDWLQYTIDWPSGMADWPLDRDEEIIIARTCIPHLHVTGLPPARARDNGANGMQGYSKTFDMLWATVHVNPMHRAQKIGVRMTGGDLGAYRDLGGTEERLIQFVNHANGMTSRIDIAFDLFDFGVDLKQIYKDWTNGKVETRARKVRPLTEGTMESGKLHEATTLYFGSRTSEVMVRMYEKGKEQETNLDWLRVELEIKGDRAITVAKDCERLGVGAVGRQLLREYITKAPYKFWKELIKSESVALTTVNRRKTDRQIWLENIVFPLLRDEMTHEWDNEQFTGITEALEGIIRGNWQRRATEIRKQYGLIYSGAIPRQ